MKNPIPLNLVFEDEISEFVMLKLTDKAKKFFVSNSYSEGGFGYIRKNISGFNEAAKGCPFFVLTDLDAADCAPNLIATWLKEPQHENLIFRVAVKEVEAWLLADIEGFSKYIGVSASNFSDAVEEINDPKAELMRLVQKSKKKGIKEDIVPKDEFARVGPNYNGRLADFVINKWSLTRALKRSDSLKRTVRHLTNFAVTYN